MKSRILFCAVFVCSLAFAARQGKSGPVSTASDIPHLQKQGAATQLMVDGKPFLGMYYNFVRIHQTLRVTPAMAAGVTDRLWSIEDLVGLFG